MSFVLTQGLTGLASASSLFLVAAGLTVIFGVTRVVNFAHGSLFMLGAYIAWSLLTRLPRDPAFFALGVLGAALATGLIGALLEVTLLRRLYRSDALFQLLATFGVVLIVQDLVPLLWGPADLPLPRPPWLRAFVRIGEARFPRWDLILIAIGPLVLGALWVVLRRTRFGMLVRAATENRHMAAALGIDQRRLFTAVFAVGSALAGLAGALTLPSSSANLHMDLTVVVDAFAVVVIGGMGSVTGAFLAALLIGELQAFGIVLLPQATLVLMFALMALVLILRPFGLLGAAPASREEAAAPRPVGPPSALAEWALLLGLAAAALAPMVLPAYPLAVLTEALIAIVFATSLHLMMGPGGMPSFGHAAWFGLGAYGAGLAVTLLAAPVPLALLAGVVLAGVAALLLGLCVVRLSGVYLAMLTLAFAQIVWAAATQWRDVTGGDDGLLGLWPDLPVRFYWVVLALAAATTWLLRRVQYAPFGMALRAVRDAAPRAAASGLPNDRLRLAAFAVSGAAAGVSGALFAFAKGSVFPTYLAIGHSVDALLMVLLGGVQSVSGPVLGALVYTGLYDVLLQVTPYWRAVLGAAVLVVVLSFPYGLAGTRLSRRAAAADGVVTPADPAAPAAGARLAPAADRPSAALVVEDLRKTYGGIDALAGVSFALRPGELVALIGPNGAGKSTCFAVLAGQQRADSGRVLLDGAPVGGLAPDRLLRRGVGRSFQIAARFASMSLRENVQVALFGCRGGVWAAFGRLAHRHRAAGDALLAAVGLAGQGDRPAAALAYGDVKRLELAIALAGAPRLLLLDEPTAGMAPPDRRALMALVRDLARATGCTVLFTEHDMEAVFGTADRILVLDRGRLIAAGPPEAIRADPHVQAVYLGTS